MEACEALQVEALLSPAVAGPEAKDDAEEILCRICLETQSAALSELPLLRPCRCRGTMGYVHAECLQRWRSTSRRPESLLGCDQCGAAYRFRKPFWLRVVTSSMFLAVVTLALFCGVADVCGMAGSTVLRLQQPELFASVHPYYVQSDTFQPVPASVPAVLRQHGTKQHATYQSAGSVFSYWEYMLGPMVDEEAWDEPEVDDAPLHLHTLGAFQPRVLVQLVQGMLERVLEKACGIMPWSFATSPLYRLRHATRASVASTSAPAVVSPPLTSLQRWVWNVSLGLAIFAIVSMMNIVLVVSMLGHLRLGAPFVAVDYAEYGGPNAHAQTVWECTSLSGLVLFLVIVWGIVRSFEVLHRRVRRVARILAARLPTRILDYSDRVR